MVERTTTFVRLWHSNSGADTLCTGRNSFHLTIMLMLFMAVPAQLAACEGAYSRTSHCVWWHQCARRTGAFQAVCFRFNDCGFDCMGGVFIGWPLVRMCICVGRFMVFAFSYSRVSLQFITQTIIRMRDIF